MQSSQEKLLEERVSDKTKKKTRIEIQYNRDCAQYWPFYAYNNCQKKRVSFIKKYSVDAEQQQHYFAVVRKCEKEIAKITKSRE